MKDQEIVISKGHSFNFYYFEMAYLTCSKENVETK